MHELTSFPVGPSILPANWHNPKPIEVKPSLPLKRKNRSDVNGFENVHVAGGATMNYESLKRKAISCPNDYARGFGKSAKTPVISTSTEPMEYCMVNLAEDIQDADVQSVLEDYHWRAGHFGRNNRAQSPISFFASASSYSSCSACVDGSDSFGAEGHMAMAKSRDSDDEDDSRAKHRAFPLPINHDWTQWSRDVVTYQMRKGKSSYLITNQADAESYSAEEELEIRALLGAANAIDPNILTALVTYATQNSRKYVKDAKRPKAEEYHNQQ